MPWMPLGVKRFFDLNNLLVNFEVATEVTKTDL
jgi:hypothetical protein